MSDLDRLIAGLTPDERDAVAMLNTQRLAVEKARLRPEHAAKMTAPVYGVFDRLRRWNSLVRDMEADWSGSVCMVYEYLNELSVRAAIEESLAEMPESLRRKVADFMADVDARFVEVTVEDGGAELAQHWAPLAEGRESRWWYVRKPKVLPRGW